MKNNSEYFLILNTNENLNDFKDILIFQKQLFKQKFPNNYLFFYRINDEEIKHNKYSEIVIDFNELKLIEQTEILKEFLEVQKKL